jgi:hypothetical protein
MPQLPTRNTLDYTPDSIISASKRISIVQSSQMKDANETSASLRPVKDSNETKAEVAKFSEIISTIADTFNDLRRIAINRGNQGLNELVNEELDREEGAGRQLVSRLYGGMPPKKDVKFKMPSGSSATITDYFQKVSSSNDPRRPSVPEFHERGESKGQARSSAREHDFDELYDAEGGDDDPNPEDDDDDDEDDESDDDTGLSELSQTATGFDDDGDDQFSIPDNETKFGVKDQIVARLIKATKLMREADMSVNRLKDSSRYLTDADIEELKMAYNILIKKWESLQYPFSGMEQSGRRYQGGFDFFDLISATVEFSANILKVLNDERKKLMMDILIVVNSYNANESLNPRFDPSTLVQPVKNVLDDFGTENIVTASVLGSGRNFFGKTINDSRDIPNIYGRHQACPTKYLL